MEDDLLLLYVNGNRIARIIVSNVNEAGRIGLGGFTEPSDLSTYYFDNIKVYQESQFRFEGIPELPHTLVPGEFLAVEVLFEPAKRGFHQDVMHIATNNVFEPCVDVLLTGTGISNKRYVKMDGDDANDGLSWATAKATIQAALEIAGVGDDIWVAAGTYYPTSSNGMDPGNERAYHFRLKEGVFLYGGFNGAETSLEQRDWETNLTLLSGDVNELGNDHDNCYHIIYNDGNQHTEHPFHLDGFTIRSLQSLDTEPFTFNYGRGLYGYYDDLTITNCVFKYNKSSEDAAGAYIEGCNIQLINCIFENNWAIKGDGSALLIIAVNVSVLECRFLDNLIGPEDFDFTYIEKKLRRCSFYR